MDRQDITCSRRQRAKRRRDIQQLFSGFISCFIVVFLIYSSPAVGTVTYSSPYCTASPSNDGIFE
ncbi:hypothetical protein J6590_075284 [Homalodisca vitripennis]|nr:hypothetical protein J6590_075284 [Homalodisca vitripennis]